MVFPALGQGFLSRRAAGATAGFQPLRSAFQHRRTQRSLLFLGRHTGVPMSPHHLSWPATPQISWRAQLHSASPLLLSQASPWRGRFRSERVAAYHLWGIVYGLDLTYRSFLGLSTLTLRWGYIIQAISKLEQRVCSSLPRGQGTGLEMSRTRNVQYPPRQICRLLQVDRKVIDKYPPIPMNLV